MKPKKIEINNLKKGNTVLFKIIYQSPKEIIVDPFGGKIISRLEASEITGLRLNDKDFVPASKRDIITRMLRNLIHTAETRRNSSEQ